MVCYIYIYIYRERERERNSLDLVFQSFQHEKYFKSFPSPGLGPGPSPSSDHIGTWDMQAGLHHFLWDRPNLIGLLHTISPLVKIDYFKVDGNFVPILKL